MTNLPNGMTTDIYQNIPQELKERRQWVVWRMEWRENRPKPTKVPFQINSEKAKTNDSRTWGTFEEVIQTFKANDAKNHTFQENDPVTAFNGIGYVFSTDDPYTGIDFDNCVWNGHIKEYVKDAIKKFNSYTERSQSGKGIHSIVKAKLPSETGRKNTQLDIEVYEKERFFVMTGNFIQGTPLTIETRQNELDQWFNEIFPPRQARRPQESRGESPRLNDDEIIEKASNEANGVFKDLFYNGAGPDHSSSDLALCNKIAFYTQDFDQIDRIFRQSALMRDKWDERRGAEFYNEKTINEALNGLTRTYSGSQRRDFIVEERTQDESRRWQDKLQKTDKGNNYSNAYNVLLILQNDENLKDKFAFNLLRQKPEIIGKVPWNRISESKEMTDHDDSCLRNYFSIRYGIKAKEIIFDAINQTFADKKYHPVRQYLKKVYPTWDGQPRIDTILIDFFDAEDTILNRWQTRLTLVGAVQRAFEHGSKMDYVLTLKGDQGLGKSSFFQTLTANKEWFSDSLDDIRGKDAKEQILGNWIIELGEMAAVGKADQKRLKQFITSTEDEFREAYGRRTRRHPRQCIFVATTNDDLPLKDDTGGRRWWIVDVKSKWFEKNFPLEVDQIWAESVHVYREMKSKNEPLKLPDTLEYEARKIQTQNTDNGIFASQIEFVLQRGYIERKDFQGHRTKVPIVETCAFHVWEEVLNRNLSEINKGIAREINAVLKNLEGWEKCETRKVFMDYGKQTVYRKIDQTDI